MISDFYQAELPRRSENTIQGIPTAYNFPPITYIGGDIDDEITSTDVSI